MRSLAIATALALAASSAGCAAIAAKAPDPDRPRDRPPICNDGKGGVAVDGLMTGALGLSTLALASDGAGEAAAITGLMAFAYGLSAASGNSSANKCRAANEEYAAIYDQEELEAIAARNRGGGSIGGVPFAPGEEDEPGGISPESVGLPPITPPSRPPTVVTAPRPAPAAPVPAPAPRPAPAPARDDDRDASASDGGGDGDWSDFWKEVPR